MRQSVPNLPRLEDTSPAAGRDSAAVAAFEAQAAPETLVAPGALVDIAALVDLEARVDIAVAPGFQGRAASGQEPR